MTLPHNQTYKLKYRPTPPSVLGRYKSLPPPMTGNPAAACLAEDWDQRCQIIYEHMISPKNGIVPSHLRYGLWSHEI